MTVGKWTSNIYSNVYHFILLRLEYERGYWFPLFLLSSTFLVGLKILFGTYSAELAVSMAIVNSYTSFTVCKSSEAILAPTGMDLTCFEPIGSDGLLPANPYGFRP